MGVAKLQDGINKGVAWVLETAAVGNVDVYEANGVKLGCVANCGCQKLEGLYC